MRASPQPKGFRYYLHDGASVFRFVLKGNLTASEVKELEQCRLTAASILQDRPFVVDVNAVIDWDLEGHALLQSWHGGGAVLVASTATGKRLLRSVTGDAPDGAESTARTSPALPQSLRRVCTAIRGWHVNGSPLP